MTFFSPSRPDSVFLFAVRRSSCDGARDCFMFGEEMPQQIFNVFVPTFAKAKPVIYAATNYRLKLLIPYARRSTTNNSFFLIKSLLGPRLSHLPCPPHLVDDEAFASDVTICWIFCTRQSHNRNFKYLPALWALHKSKNYLLKPRANIEAIYKPPRRFHSIAQ